MERFNKACLKIINLPTEAAVMELVNGLRDGPFSQSVSKRHPTSMSEIQERAEKEPEIKKNKEGRRESDREYSKVRKYHFFTPLRTSLLEVYRDICNVKKLPTPRPIRSKSAGNKSDYCGYHRLYMVITPIIVMTWRM
ncbi:hypothetical protein PIB30_054050 [Stylosanthes scabra]|uniref:Uncharacterized protein n=1 Tax=Stylosanthes scabra TaxID=79078 RepID=A0ABU6TIF1_9FABA|nr:hypothetical protein [Stylosanthes scabra]